MTEINYFTFEVNEPVSTDRELSNRMRNGDMNGRVCGQWGGENVKLSVSPGLFGMLNDGCCLKIPKYFVHKHSNSHIFIIYLHKNVVNRF